MWDCLFLSALKNPLSFLGDIPVLGSNLEWQKRNQFVKELSEQASVVPRSYSCNLYPCPILTVLYNSSNCIGVNYHTLDSRKVYHLKLILFSILSESFEEYLNNIAPWQECCRTANMKYADFFLLTEIFNLQSAF